MSARHAAGSVVALSGGVGGARLVHGLAMALPADALSVVVNTGDDFVHWGLTICPDLDTVMYTLADLSDRERGWGLAGETFSALAMVERYGGPSWFMLGDRDLGTHLVRTQALAAGQSLTQATLHACRALGVGPRLLPMADLPRPTHIITADGRALIFQEWFVRERCPAVARVESRGTDQPAEAALAAIERADLIIIGPSNPYVSIDPILSLSGVREALRGKLVVAVSPIVEGRAVKGPLAEMLQTVDSAQPGAAAVLAHYQRRYGDIISGFVVAPGDIDECAPLIERARLFGTDIIMRDLPGRERLAREVLAFAGALT